jgi:hypothetical protein
MKSTGIFTTQRFNIQFKNYGEPIYLIPFGDVHRDSPLHAESHWKDTLEWAKGKPRCFFLGMGDMLDLASTSERKILGNPELHESTTTNLDVLVLNQVEKFVKEIEFMRGRIIGLIEGNHYWVFQNATTSTQKMCELLGCKYLGTMSYIRIIFEKSGRIKHSNEVKIIAHHGIGTSRVAGGDMRPVEMLAGGWACDIALMGDDHQKGLIIRTRNEFRGNREVVRAKKILLARTGCFLRGFVEGQASYVVDKCYSPNDIGLVKIEMTPRRDYSDGGDETYIDLHASL